MTLIYCFDLDGTLVTEHSTEGADSDYTLAKPIPNAVKRVRELWKEGNEIIIMTARGKRSGIDSTEFTKQQLKEFDIPYDSLMMNVKPHADVFVDDKAWNARDWRSSTKEPNWLKKT